MWPLGVLRKEQVGGGGGGDINGGALTKAVAKTGIAQSTSGYSVNYTLAVPSGATNLSFAMSGGTGDADMYVKFGSAPTDSSYDCRPYKSGNAETCTFATPSAGTYYVRLKADSAFSGVSLLADYTTGGGGGSVGVLRLSLPFATNATDTSGNAIPTRTVQGTPTYSSGSLLLDNDDVIATGTTDGQVQSSLNTTGKGWQIEFDVQMITNSSVKIFIKSIYTSDAVPALSLENSTGMLRFRSHANQFVFDVDLGFDMSAAFFNVKIVQTTTADYPKLYINNNLIATCWFSGDLFGNSTNQAGFVFGTGSNGTGFKIKNFKFYTT